MDSPKLFITVFFIILILLSVLLQFNKQAEDQKAKADKEATNKRYLLRLHYIDRVRLKRIQNEYKKRINSDR